MYVLIKTVNRNGKKISEEILTKNSSDPFTSQGYLVYAWEEATTLLEAFIKGRIKEAKKMKKSITYNGDGNFTTVNGFEIQYTIQLLTRVRKEDSDA